MNIVIPYWHKCNNRCVMCTNPIDGLSLEEGGCFDSATLHECLDKNKMKWHEVDSVYITGGETTMRPDFFDSLSDIAESFPFAKISILSNGRRFFYTDFAKKCLSYPSVNYIIPIHGWNSKSHDKITGVQGSFDQTISGLENLFSMRQMDQEIEVRIIIHKINYKKINKILDLLLKKFPAVDRLVLVFIEYEGHAIKNLKSVELSYDKFYPQFDLLEKYLKKFKEIRFYHFPLCAMPKKFWPYMWRTFDADEVIFLSK
ncbi:MAG: radical SAM protein [Parcubacteria group bacterium]